MRQCCVDFCRKPAVRLCLCEHHLKKYVEQGLSFTTRRKCRVPGCRHVIYKMNECKEHYDEHVAIGVQKAAAYREERDRQRKLYKEQLQ